MNAKKIAKSGKIEDMTVAESIKVGDYVDYEPTKTDVNKIQKIY